MSLELGVARSYRIARTTDVIETILIRIGVCGTMCLLILSALQYSGLVHTDVTWFIVDQLVHGESRFNANGDVHGDWGNQAHAVLVAPIVLGFLGAACVTLLRSVFTEAAE